MTFEELSARAIQQQQDLEAIRASQARSQADLRLQIAQGKIDYTVGSEYRRQQGISGTGNSLGFFFSAPLPVFNRNQGEVERARRESEQATARIRALDATIRNQLKSAWQRYESWRALLDQVENTMVDQAQQVRKTTEYSYRRGEATLVEFLDAQRAFNDTMQTYNEARADYARSLYLLDALAGTGTGTTEARPMRVTPSALIVLTAALCGCSGGKPDSVVSDTSAPKANPAEVVLASDSPKLREIKVENVTTARHAIG